MSIIYLVLAGLYLIGLIARDIYEVLKKAHRIDPENPWIFATVFTSMIIMWLSWFAMVFFDPFRITLLWLFQGVGLAAIIVGFGLAVGGMWQLKGVENIDHLVTTGLFSKIRHPMYVGFILWILGFGVLTGAYMSLAIGSLGIVSILWWRGLEETEMESRYGPEYTEYHKNTWL